MAPGGLGIQTTSSARRTALDARLKLREPEAQVGAILHALDCFGCAASPQLADSPAHRDRPGVLALCGRRRIRLPDRESLSAHRQRSRPAAELWRMADLLPQRTGPGGRDAHRLPAHELPGGPV